MMHVDDILLGHILKIPPIEIAIKRPVLTPAQQRAFEALQRRLIEGEPLQYILGSWSFMGLELMVNPSVLVPRPETEQLVDEALRIIKVINEPRILDLGTGSGNIAIVLAKFHPKARVISLDISDQALEVAKANARQHGVLDRIEFVQVDMRSSLLKDCFASLAMTPSFGVPCSGTRAYDLIISNPPYIPSGQMEHLPLDVQQEPRLALDGGADGLDFYRIIIKNTPHLLTEHGCLMMEFGDGQSNSILSLLEPVFKVDIYQDLAGKERFLMARRS